VGALLVVSIAFMDSTDGPGLFFLGGLLVIGGLLMRIEAAVLEGKGTGASPDGDRQSTEPRA
jgi:hypothetical protein